MRPGAEAEPIAVSPLEFDVLCESEGIVDYRHIVLDVPSPGATYTERAELVASAWEGLRTKGLAEPRRNRADPDFGDLLALLDRPRRSVDVRIWADRSIRALASSNGGAGLLAIVDTGVVELTPIRGSALADAAVSVAGDGPPGEGRSVSVLNDSLRAAGELAGQHDPQRLIDELRALGVPSDDAALVSRMAEGMGMRGQFGAQSAFGRGSAAVRADRVIGFHDTPAGRYLHVVRPSGDGRRWSTIAPADNARIAEYVGELLGEVVEHG